MAANRMTGTFVRLRLSLLGNTFRKSVWQTVGMILAALSALSAVGTAVILAAWGGAVDAALTGDILIIAGAVLVLCWWLIPLLIFGVDASMDAKRFVLYPLPRRSLLTGLAAAGVISVPGIATALALLGVVLAWAHSPLALVAALIGAVGALALCIIGSRAITTLAAPLLESRRARELLSIFAFVLIMGLSPLINWIVNMTAEAGESGTEVTLSLARDALATFSHRLGWTPFGAPWALASAIANGQWVAALGHFAILAATVALLAFLWNWAITRELERPAQAAASKAVKGLGFFNHFPATPTGAIAARSATYWLRDPRYGIGLIAVAMMPIVLIVAGRGGGGEAMPVTLILAPIVAWMLGFMLANDVASDDTAFALHVASGVSGEADRRGRALPVMIVAFPVVILFATITAWLNGRWDWLVPLLGLSLSLLFSSVGVSSATGARWLWPTPKPGESPLKQPQGGTMGAMVAQSVSLGLSAAAGLIPTGLAVAAFVTHGTTATLLGWLTLIVGLAIGIGVFVFGMRWGGRTLERRGPELLQQIKAFP